MVKDYPILNFSNTAESDSINQQSSIANHQSVCNPYASSNFLKNLSKLHPFLFPGFNSANKNV